MTDPTFVGSAHVLEGRVYPLSVFISAPATPWVPEDKLRVIGHERRAEAWIMTQAARCLRAGTSSSTYVRNLVQTAST